jgi:hypothetical protein
MLNYFFCLSSYPTENKLLLKYSFGLLSCPIKNRVDVQRFFRPQRVRHKEHGNPVTMATEVRFSDNKDFRNRKMIWNAYWKELWRRYNNYATCWTTEESWFHYRQK